MTFREKGQEGDKGRRGRAKQNGRPNRALPQSQYTSAEKGLGQLEIVHEAFVLFILVFLR